MEEDIHGLLPDGGGYYAETNPQNFVLEPWNAVSSLAFLVPVIYYMVKLKGRYREKEKECRAIGQIGVRQGRNIKI